MKFALAAFFISIFLLPAFAAGDFNGDSLRSFCQTLLNISDASSFEVNMTNVSAFAPPINITTRSDAYYEAVAEMVSANASIQKMANAGLPVIHARDLYLAAGQWLDGQSAKEEIGETSDYRFVSQNVQQILQLESSSFALQDEFNVLDLRLANATSGANLTAALALRDSALAEFRDERFDEAKTLIDQAYAEISSAEAEAVRSQTLLESTRKNVETFLRENWQTILAIIAVVCVLLFIFQKRIRRFLINSKINSLSREKVVLQGMLRDLQRDYFQHGSGNEMTYRIKTKKFADLIRNINRQLPMLKEELKRI